ncbi:histone N-acetyltransferase [Schizosaccharomyces japonicus yFS275]|uniref:N-alpha-acetyltransferase 40 n=1 Tax=Schizosaccharomyces japonicus (strain yFS275 / FY16936) TaxID=402676 RepID=B6K4H6_SCHJY|nr:histone N-acetyltransferase [Schizosaccharomyces japonicus yFS275]EEB08383.1 histone N-acetyltransferase [Schizosaccharomyces japonicus yFS275]
MTIPIDDFIDDDFVKSQDLSVVILKNINKNEDIKKKCFNLVKKNMFAMYKRSCFGWEDSEKLKEMSLTPLVYVCLLHEQSKELVAFTSLEDTEEDNVPCLYMYELQVCLKYRAHKLGSWLTYQAAVLAHEYFQKDYIFLTVFSENKKAMSFYKKFGFKRHTSSPAAIRKLRSGRIIEPDYYIFYSSVATITRRSKDILTKDLDSATGTISGA